MTAGRSDFRSRDPQATKANMAKNMLHIRNLYAEISIILLNHEVISRFSLEKYRALSSQLRSAYLPLLL
jgi:hypothetical protein